MKIEQILLYTSLQAIFPVGFFTQLYRLSENLQLIVTL